MMQAFEINTKHSGWLGIQLLKGPVKPNSFFSGLFTRKGSRKSVLQIFHFCSVKTDPESYLSQCTKIFLAQTSYAMLSLKMQEISN